MSQAAKEPQQDGIQKEKKFKKIEKKIKKKEKKKKSPKKEDMTFRFSIFQTSKSKRTFSTFLIRAEFPQSQKSFTT